MARRLKRQAQMGPDLHARQADVRGDAAWYGFPGPAWPPEEGEPIRVICHAFAAWGEGQETYWAELASAMPREWVRWHFLVEPPRERKGVADVGAALRELGEVRVLPEGKHLVPAAVRQAVIDWRPHVAHATNALGAEHLLACGLPVLMARDGVAGLSACAWPDGVRARVAQSAAAVGDDWSSVEVIPNGLAPGAWPKSRRKGAVALVGRLDADRRPELALQAMALVREAQLDVVGVARWREFDPIAMARALGYADRVRWHGQVPRERAREIAASADVILGTAQEGFGYGLLEGILGGAIPIVVDGPGYQVTLAREAGGIVAEADPAQLARAITRALALGRSEADRRAAVNGLAQKYSAQAMASAYLAVYERLLAPVVDIIVVAHGEKAVTRACLLHLLAHTWWPYRLIMIDNGSPGDEIRWLMREVALLSGTRCVILESDWNRGCAGGRRLGLDHSQAQYIVTLDNDMLVPPGWLGPLMETMLEHHDAGAVGAWWSAYGPQRAAGPVQKIFGCSAAVLRRTALPADAYATDLAPNAIGNDTDLLWQMLEAGWKLYLDPRSYWLHLGGPPGLLGMTRRKQISMDDERAGRTAFAEKWAAPGVRRK